MQQIGDVVKIYTRVNEHVCFMLPTCAFGRDVDGRMFFEVGFLIFALGIGDA